MDIFKSRYYKNSRAWMEFVGLWPYQNQARRQISQFIYYTLNLSLVVPQMRQLFFVERNFNIFIENTMSILFTFVCLTKYRISYFSASRFKLLFSQIAKDWEKIEDENEIKILSEHSEQGRLLVLFYIVYIFWAWAMFNLMPFLPFLMDMITPLENRSHPLIYPFYADYFWFNQADYHYGTCCHALVVYFVATSMFAGIDTIYVATVKHACGLFDIICYRLEIMARTEGKNNSKSIDIANDAIVQQDLIRAIILHEETIECCNLLENSFSLCFLIVQSMCVIAIAVGSFYSLSVYEDTYKFYRIAAFCSGTLIHLFYLHWVGQQIIDRSERIFHSAYASDWYKISSNSRKFINIIMARSLNPRTLTAGKITPLSMETFGILMKTSMSYFTVLLSIA